MYPEFEAWLSVRVSPERQALITDAFEMLSELLDLTVYDSAVNAMLLTERLDTQTALDDLNQELMEYCIAATLQYGITLNEDVYSLEHQAVVNKLLMTLLQVDQWEDGHRILAICENDESAEEIFAGLCEEITSIDPELILSLVSEVSVDKLDALTEHYRNKLRTYEPSVPTWYPQVISVAKQYPNSTVGKWLLEANTIGLTFDQYVQFHVEAFANARLPQDHAINWVLMAMASGEFDTQKIYGMCVSKFDTVYQNLDTQSRVVKALKLLLSTLQ